MPAPCRARGAARSAAQSGTPAGAVLSGCVLAVARGSDHAAFAVLFSHFAPRLKTYFLRSGLADAAAEELAQETMVLVWRKAGLFDPAKGKGWSSTRRASRGRLVRSARRARRRGPRRSGARRNSARCRRGSSTVPWRAPSSLGGMSAARLTVWMNPSSARSGRPCRLATASPLRQSRLAMAATDSAEAWICARARAVVAAQPC